jgi:hypothetical protein
MWQDGDRKNRGKVRIRLTALCLKARERCWAPSEPILLFSRFNVVSVCVTKSRCTKEEKSENEVHSIIFEDMSQILHSISTNQIVSDVERG